MSAPARQPETKPLKPDTAAKLYPDAPCLQAEWRRAVSVVRATSRGWLLDQPQGRRA